MEDEQGKAGSKSGDQVHMNGGSQASIEDIDRRASASLQRD